MHRSTTRPVPTARLAAAMGVAVLLAACGSPGSSDSGAQSTSTTEAPPELVEDICFSPGIWPNCRSSGAVTVEASTSGLPPG